MSILSICLGLSKFKTPIKLKANLINNAPIQPRSVKQGEKQRIRIIEFIEDQPGISQIELVEKMQLSRQMVRTHIKYLLADDVITEYVPTNNNQRKAYYLKDDE